ncbi:ribonuclease III [Candidatus Peregrinibacteria bacterium]|nr:ribonuclease III [Candidatus Peregrinibacteria bacterium]
MTPNKYKKLEEKIGIKFKNLDILTKAFVHRSYINEHKNENIEDNERLEFLGDAVLELVATKHLFETCPNKAEGEMTSFRSALVRGKNLADVSEELSLGKYLFLSKGEEKSGGRKKNYILANTLEALIGAIYLDQGYHTAEEFIEKFIMAELDEIIEKELHIDAKSRFQEICQEKEGITPHYKIIAEEGPDHNKQFTMGAYIDKKQIATGTGSSKHDAEDEAARNALKVKRWET